jgi:hypothetical protein
MDDGMTIPSGIRVRLRDAPFGVRLRSLTGVVEQFDSSEGYCIVRLDEPAMYIHADGTEENLPAICEAGDNLIPEPHDDFEFLADSIANHFEEQGISRADVEDAIRWARKS